MAGFLSADQITKIRDLADTLHTTFARTITVYRNATKRVIVTTDTWNSLYGRTNTGSDSNIEYTIDSQTFSARIYYDDMDTAYLNDGGRTEQAGSQNKVLVADGTVRIVVQEAAYNYLVEARRVEFNGKKFIIESDGEPRGLTENQFYTFVLSPVDE